MQAECKQCGQPIPEGRGSKNGKTTSTQTKFCSKDCCRAYNNEIQGNKNRLYPKGTNRGDAINLSGAAAEALVISRLLLRGYQVYKAVSPASRQDLLVEISGKYRRVEVKSARRLQGQVVNRMDYRLDTQHYDILANVVLLENLVEFTPDPSTFEE